MDTATIGFYKAGDSRDRGIACQRGKADMMHKDRSHSNYSDQPRKPRLSLIACSRNDQYMGNSLWRLQTALDDVAQSVHAVGREGDLEILVTDWGSKIPLHTVLQLSPAAARLISFIIVPPALAQEIQGDSPFSEVVALNGAARRANGQCVGRIDQDTLVGTRFLRTFLELYEGKQQLDVPLESALMLSNRHQIPFRFASRCPSFWEADRFIRWFGRFLGREMYHLPPRLFLRIIVGIWLVHRDVWYECAGYDERMKCYYWMETDMILRLMQREHTVVDLGKLVDYDLYHLEHYTPRIDWPEDASRKANPAIDLNNPPEDLEFHPNSEDWGGIQYPLEVVAYSPDEGDVETVALDQSRSSWLGFTLLLLSSGVLMVWDKLLAVSWLAARGFASRWKHRNAVA